MSANKGAMFDPNNFTEGGGFSLDNVEGIIVASSFKYTNWAKKDGTIPTYKDEKGEVKEVEPSTVWEIEVKTDDADDPIQARLKASSYLMPSEDGVKVSKSKTGPFLVDPEGKREPNLNKNVAAAFFLTSLANAGFDFSSFAAEGAGAILNYRLAFSEIQRKDEKTGKDIGKNKTPVVTKIVHGPGGKGKTAAKPKPKAAAPAEGESDGGNGFDADATAMEYIIEVLSEHESLPKGKVSVEVNKKAVDAGLDKESRLAVLKASTKEELLSSGPWSYANGILSA